MQAAAPVTSPGDTQLPHRGSAQFQSYLDAASSVLEQDDDQGCFHYLDLAVESLNGEVDLDRVESLLIRLAPFQSSLIEREQYPQIRQWICPSPQGLLGRLACFAENSLPLARQVISALEQGYQSLPDQPNLQVVELKLAYLTKAYHLAKRHELREEQIRLLPLVGDLHLTLGDLLPADKCYEGGYRVASICYNIALDLSPQDESHFEKPSLVESAYLHRVRLSCEGLTSWAESYIWTGRSPAHVQRVVQLTELALEYGDLPTARALYFESVRYAQKFPFAGSEQLQVRHLQLSQAEVLPSRSRSWRLNRQALSAIRLLTSFLFSRYFSETPMDPPEFQAALAPLVLESMKQARFLSAERESLEQFADHLTDHPPSIHQLQDLHGRLMIGFTEQLFEQAICLFGRPPCNYTLAGLGSLARGEMSIYSDLDAIVLVERRDDQVIEYFQQVANYFELLIMNLGETKCSFARFDHLHDRFCLDPAALHPARIIETPERLLSKQTDELQSLRLGSDLDPIRNALRLVCPISGSEELHVAYTAQLQAFFASERQGEGLGNFLLTKWRAPHERENSLDAKQDLYRPITLLIDALSVKHNILRTRTTERLQSFRAIFPHDFVTLCEGALELACRLRLQAQIHYGEESETIFLEPDPNIDRPLLLSAPDRALLERIDELLFKPLGQMDLTEGLNPEVWMRAKIALAEKLLREERIAEVTELLASLSDPPPELAAPMALCNRDFERAGGLSSAQHDQRAFDSFNPYQQAHQSAIALPADLPLRRFAGHLHFLQMRGYREELHPPPHPIFHGDAMARRRALWRYLTRLPLAGDLHVQASSYAHDCFYGKRPPPVDAQALLTHLVPVEQATLNDLLYGDLLLALQATLRQTQEKQVLSYLFHLFPPAIKGRFLQELTRAGGDPQLIELLAHFPQPDGSRPHSRSEKLSLTLDILRGGGNGSLKGVRSSECQLSEEASSFFAGLIRGKKGRYGRHSVDKINGRYCKLDPEFPGREFAYLALVRLITGEAFPPRELIKVTLRSKVHAVSVSSEVPGPSLQEVLDSSPHELDRLDFHHYSFAVLMSLLALPEDAKPDNFILFEPAHGAPVQLIDIDPERIFFPAMKSRFMRSDQLQCKSILFCLDQMKRPIDPQVAAEFLALHPAALFERWLEEIDHYNEKANELFGTPFVDRSMRATPTTEIPVFLEPSICGKDKGILRHKGLLLRLYERFRIVQGALRSKPQSRLIDLLLLVEPQLGARYQAELDCDKPAIKRFCDLTANEYKRSKGSTLSITSTRLRGAYSTVEDFRKHGWTIENAKQDLRKILVAHSTRGEIIKDLISGEGVTLKTLDLPEISDNVLKSINFSRLPPAVQRQVLDRITGLQFRRLHLVGCQVLTDRKLEVILRHSPHLTLLDLVNSKGITSLTYLSKHCAKIEKLNLRGITTLVNLSEDQWLSSGPAKLPSLQSLDISGCGGLQRLAIEALNLKRLRCLGSLPALFSLQPPYEAPLKLERLWVDSDETLNSLLKFTPASVVFANAEITPVDSSSPHQLPSTTAIFRSARSIVYQCGSGDLSAMIKRAQRIGYYSFRIRARIGRQRIECFARPLDRVRLAAIADHCPQLSSLDLSGCEKLTDVALTAIAQNCPQLSSLNLSWCTQLTDAAIIPIAQHCPQLSSLDLSGCEKLTDAALIRIAQHCPQLSSLDLSGCDKLTDAALTAIAQHCPQLSSLDLSGCKQLTDADLIPIAQHSTQLSSLDLSACDQLTDAALIAIAQHCPQLSSLDLFGCRQLTKRGRDALRALNPSLMIR